MESPVTLDQVLAEIQEGTAAEDEGAGIDLDGSPSLVAFLVSDQLREGFLGPRLALLRGTEFRRLREESERRHHSSPTYQQLVQAAAQLLTPWLNEILQQLAAPRWQALPAKLRLKMLGLIGDWIIVDLKLDQVFPMLGAWVREQLHRLALSQNLTNADGLSPDKLVKHRLGPGTAVAIYNIVLSVLIFGGCLLWAKASPAVKAAYKGDPWLGMSVFAIPLATILGTIKGLVGVQRKSYRRQLGITVEHLSGSEAKGAGGCVLGTAAFLITVFAVVVVVWTLVAS